MIGFGTKSTTASNIIQCAIESGYTFIDSKDSNTSLSEFKNVAFDRKNLWICSKLMGESSPENHNPKNVHNSCLNALQKAGLSYWDIYYMHTTYAFGNYPILETYAELLKLKQEGKTLYVGLSNVTYEQLEAIVLNSTKPDYIQIEIHPYLIEERIVQFCKSNCIKIVAHSPLGSSLWLTLSKDSVLLNLAKKYNVTVAQLVLNWHISREIIPIPSSNNKTNIVNNLQRFEISMDDVNIINILNKNKRVYVKPNHYESIGNICNPLPKRKLMLNDLQKDNGAQSSIVNDIVQKGFHICKTHIDDELHSLCIKLLQKNPNEKALVDKIKQNKFIVSVSNKYGTILNKCVVRTNVPNENLMPVGTQLFHRDTQLQKTLKIIIYLSDVQKETGPLQIIYPEHDMNLKWYKDKLNARTTPEDIYQNVPKENILSIVGPKFTMILFEGSVLHCGGYVQKGYRKIVYFE